MNGGSIADFSVSLDFLLDFAMKLDPVLDTGDGLNRKRKYAECQVTFFIKEKSNTILFRLLSPLSFEEKEYKILFAYKKNE